LCTVKLPAFLTPLLDIRKHPTEAVLVDDTLRAAVPELLPDLDVVEREALPEFRQFDADALRAQNSYRLGQVVVIVGGAAATALGAVQAALGGGVIGVGTAEALVAGALAGALTYVRGRAAQQEYYNSRLKAERLRGEYFVFLARVAPYDTPDAEARLARLRERVGHITSEDTA
jgi:hypothetical protein